MDEIPKLNAEDQERLAQMGLEEPSRAGAAATVAAANSRDPEEYAADLARVSEVINAQSLSIPAGRAVMIYALALLGGPISRRLAMASIRTIRLVLARATP